MQPPAWTNPISLAHFLAPDKPNPESMDSTNKAKINSLNNCKKNLANPQINPKIQSHNLKQNHQFKKESFSSPALNLNHLNKKSNPKNQNNKNDKVNF